MNKIKFGLKNVHYAVATIAADGSATYDTPVAFPGVVSMSIDPQGETIRFHADDITYWTGASNTGYEGDLEMARMTDDFKTDVLGDTDDSNHVLYEDANAPLVHFALLFEFAGDVSATRHVLYNCTATRPAIAGKTKGENIEPQTETVTISASPIYVSAINKYVPKASTSDATTAATYSGWYSAVYVPGANT